MGKGSSYCRYRPKEVSAEQIVNPLTDTFSKTLTCDDISWLTGPQFGAKDALCLLVFCPP